MRPGRTRVSGDWRSASAVAVPGLHGYTPAPPIAFPGWRLNIPGQPPGGQYHGFTAIGNRAPLPKLVGRLVGKGLRLLEGETVSSKMPDTVYRSPSEMRPRANASGNVNTVLDIQDSKEVGFAEAPGSYYRNPMKAPRAKLGAFAVATPIMRPVGPARWIGPIYSVDQNPPSAGGPTTVVDSGGYSPVAQPAPVIGAPPSAYSPITAAPYSCANPDPQCTALGLTCGPYPNCAQPSSVSNVINPVSDPQCLAIGMTGGPYPSCTPSGATSALPASSGIMAWLESSSLISGIPNIFLAGGLVLLLVLKKK